MSDWTETSPLRVVTGYQNIARKFFSRHGFEHVVLLSADGALEAAPLMGSADIILDLISTGKLRCSCMMLHLSKVALVVARTVFKPATGRLPALLKRLSQPLKSLQGSVQARMYISPSLPALLAAELAQLLSL